MAFFARKKGPENPKIDLARINRTATLKPVSKLLLASSSKMKRAERKPAWCVCTVSARNVALREGVILNVSKTGARVRFSQRGALPETVILKAGRLGLHRRARVVWQDVFDVGLEFVT